MTTIDNVLDEKKADIEVEFNKLTKIFDAYRAEVDKYTHQSELQTKLCDKLQDDLDVLIKENTRLTHELELRLKELLEPRSQSNEPRTTPN